MDHTEHLIVGGGISGLAYADWLNTSDYLICEADTDVGGYCKTVTQDGFVWDYSGHFFHFRHPEIERYLIERMGDQRVLKVARQSRIYFGETLIDFPFQKNIHQLPREDFIDCLVDLYFKDDGPSSNFQNMLYAKFGKSIADKFLIPYNQKLYATELDRLDANAMGRFFPYANIDEIIRNFRTPDNASYNATFTYPEGGAIQYVRALQKEIPGSQISLSERVLSIDLTRRQARTNKRSLSFTHLVSTMPFHRLLRMCSLDGRLLDHDPRIYSYNQVQIFNLGFDAKGWTNAHWIYFPQEELPFYRVGFYDNIFGTDRMSLYVEIGRPADFSTDAQATASTLDSVLSALRHCGIVTDQNMISHHHVVLDPAYVHITQASLGDVAEKKALLDAHGVHSIGRYGSWTYCSIEDNIVEARALADELGKP